MSPLVKLDDLSLSLILAKLSIQDMWTSGRVCVRLSGARRNCANVRRELALVVGKCANRFEEESGLNIPERRFLVDEDGNVMFPEKDVQLQIYSFPLDFARLLLTHFTNLTSLTICSRVYSKDLDSIIHLLEQFNRPNGTLNTLKLYSNQDNQHTELNTNQIQNIRTYLRLLSTVNSIGSLKKLTVDVNTKLVRNAKYPRIDLPILAQLEEFEFNSADEFVCLYDSITRYAVNNQGLRRIAINYPTDDFAWLLALPTELSSRFTHIHFRLNYRSETHFEDLCIHFSHLTSLELTIEQFFQFILGPIRALTHLTNLISLVVNSMGFLMTALSLIRREMMNFELPSVKVLTIKIVGLTRSHHFLHDCNMIRLFPNVQIVRIIRDDALCSKCNKRNFSNIECQIVRLEVHCARYMFRHFVHSQQLRMVSAKFVGRKVVGPRHRQSAWNEMPPFENDYEEYEYEEVVPFVEHDYGDPFEDW